MSEIVLTLPDSLAKEARENGLFTPERAAALFRAELRRRRAPTSESSKRSIRNLFGKGRSGDPNGSDNEKIDADLAGAYLDPHDD